MKKLKRIRKVVDHSLQFRLTGAFLMGSILAFLLFGGGLLGYFWVRGQLYPGMEFIRVSVSVEKSVQVEEAGVLVTKTYPESVDLPPMTPVEYLTPVLILNNLLILIILAFLGIHYSHKIAGPMYNINRALDLAAQGRLTRLIQLRRGDFFHDTAEKLNKVIPLAGNETKPEGL